MWALSQKAAQVRPGRKVYQSLQGGRGLGWGLQGEGGLAGKGLGPGFKREE